MKKNFIKSMSQFIKSFLLAIFLALITIIISECFIEPHAYNFVTKAISGLVNASDETVIIAVDDKSIAYRRWPWPRDFYGKIVRYLSDYTDAKVIGLDSVVQNLDLEHPESDRKFFSDISNADNLVVAFMPLVKGSFDQERNLNYNKKFNEKFSENIETSDGSGMPSIVYEGLSEFPVEYFNAIKKIGSVECFEENMYVLNIPQVIGVGENYYPSLALKMYMYATGSSKIIIDPKYITVEGTPLRIPWRYNYEHGAFQSKIRYYGTKEYSMYSHKKYSASDIIESYDNLQKGKPPIIDPAEFKDKVVFIGVNVVAVGTGIQDVVQSPIQKMHPGVDIQATNFDNIRNNEFVNEISDVQKLIILIVIMAITYLSIIKLPMIPSLFFNSIVAFGYFIVSFICYLKSAYYIMFVTPIMLQTAASIFGYSYKSVLEGRNKEKIKQAMGKYLSQDIMKNVVKNIDDIKLGGKRAIVTVLFADIRGFTSISEKLSAEEISVILNEYFTEIEPIITRYNGVINKFIGDAVMAIFGEPIQDLNHPVNAVKCAYAMLKKVEELQDKWLFEGKPKIEIGIGINTGEAFVGNIGSEKRLEYTVIGDTVNLASRIESYNKIYHTNLLVSASTYSYVSDIANVIKISDVTIRGKSRKMDIYEILKLSEDK